jgi:hypothetical protein
LLNSNPYFTESKERDCFVAFLTWLFPASLEKGVVVIDTPAGILSWGIHPSNLDMFKHLPVNMGRKAPIRTMKEKYEILLQLGKQTGGIIIALGMISGLGEKLK